MDTLAAAIHPHATHPVPSVSMPGEVTLMIPASCILEDRRSGTTLIVFKVVCTGKEERLLDCDFPQDFGADYGIDYYTPNNDYNANFPAPAPIVGLPSFDCDGDRMRFSVICRQFEITGARFQTVNADLLYLCTIAVYQDSVSIMDFAVGCVTNQNVLPIRTTKPNVPNRTYLILL